MFFLAYYSPDRVTVLFDGDEVVSMNTITPVPTIDIISANTVRVIRIFRMRRGGINENYFIEEIKLTGWKEFLYPIVHPLA
jgi:hypothetical protein